MFIVLFLIVHLLWFVLKQVKTLCLQEQRVSFCGTLNELTFHEPGRGKVTGRVFIKHEQPWCLSYKCTSFQGASRDTNLHCSVSVNLYLSDSDKDSHGLIRTMSYHSLKLPPEQTASKTAFLPLANNPSLEHSILHVSICCQSSHLGIFQVGTRFSFFLWCKCNQSRVGDS